MSRRYVNQHGMSCIKHFYHPYQLSQKSDINLIKNKLISILRSSQKQYYSGLLAKKKNDIAGTWKVHKTIMGTPRLGSVLETLCVWFAVNILTVNLTKTKYMVFGS